MRNFHLDNLLSRLTVVCFFALYLTVGVSIFRSRAGKSEEGGDSDVIIRSVSPSPSPFPSVTSEVSVAPTSSQVSATPTFTPTASPTPDSRCIISINGVSYDVTQFRFIHDGGDIFTCGKDMTSVFFGQHDTQTLQKMEKYRL